MDCLEEILANEDRFEPTEADLDKMYEQYQDMLKKLEEEPLEYIPCWKI